MVRNHSIVVGMLVWSFHWQAPTDASGAHFAISTRFGFAASRLARVRPQKYNFKNLENPKLKKNQKNAGAVVGVALLIGGAVVVAIALVTHLVHADQAFGCFKSGRNKAGVIFITIGSDGAVRAAHVVLHAEPAAFGAGVLTNPPQKLLLHALHDDDNCYSGH